MLYLTTNCNIHRNCSYTMFTSEIPTSLSIHVSWLGFFCLSLKSLPMALSGGLTSIRHLYDLWCTSFSIYLLRSSSIYSALRTLWQTCTGIFTVSICGLMHMYILISHRCHCKSSESQNHGTCHLAERLQSHRHRLSRQASFGNLGIFPFLLASTLVPKIQFLLKSWKSYVPILRGISHGQPRRSRPNKVQLRWFPKREALGNCCQQSHSWETAIGYIQRPLQTFADERENTRQLHRAMEGRGAQTHSQWGQKSRRHPKSKAFHLVMWKRDAQNWNPKITNTGPTTPMRPMNRSLCGRVTSDEPIHSPCWTLPKFITRCLSILVTKSLGIMKSEMAVL